jgi:hypothetical protein
VPPVAVNWRVPLTGTLTVVGSSFSVEEPPLVLVGGVSRRLTSEKLLHPASRAHTRASRPIAAQEVRTRVSLRDAPFTFLLSFYNFTTREREGVNPKIGSGESKKHV